MGIRMVSRAFQTYRNKQLDQHRKPISALIARTPDKKRLVIREKREKDRFELVKQG
jgi:hypothetical protein